MDQSREAREAANVVANIVKTYSSRLILLYVLEEPDDESSAGEIISSPETVAKLLEGAKSFFFQQGIEAQILEQQGKPGFTSCDVADEVNANLIVMGCRGFGLTEEGVTDRVINRVINLAPCSVLIVP